MKNRSNTRGIMMAATVLLALTSSPAVSANSGHAKPASSDALIPQVFLLNAHCLVGGNAKACTQVDDALKRLNDSMSPSEASNANQPKRKTGWGRI